MEGLLNKRNGRRLQLETLMKIKEHPLNVTFNKQERGEQIEQTREGEREQIENLQDNMALKERIKMIFKRYVLTAFSVLTSVGVII